MAKQQIIAGIDIGSSKIATIIGSLSDQEDEKIKIVGSSSVPSRGVRKGQIVDIEDSAEAVVAAVEAAERMAGYNLTRVLVAAGGPHVSSQNSKGVVAVAEPEGEIAEEDSRRVIEAAQAISLPSTREIIHVIPRHFTVDGQEGIKDPIGMSGVRLEVETHIITGSTTALRNLAKCVSEVGANIQSLVAAGLASAESVLTETERELGVVLVDIGGGVTDIVVFVEGSPFFTSTLPIGAKNVTNDLAIGLRLSLEAAEKIKLALTEAPKMPTKPKEARKDQLKKINLNENKKEDELDLADLGVVDEKKTVSRKTLSEGIIRPRLNEIFTMVGNEIKKSGAGGLTPAGLVITGGGAQTIGAVEAAKRTLSMPVRLGLPQGAGGLIDDVQQPDFATALGLVLYGSQTGVEPAISFSLGNLGKAFQKIPFRGAASKVVDLVKSFLP